MIFLNQGELSLQVNEFSLKRSQRLKQVLEQYLPEELVNSITLTTHDAKNFGRHCPEKFDAILADVPCSSEEHLIKDPKYLDDWKPKRTKRLSQDQFSILCSCIDALKPGGRLVYSTCSLSPLENHKNLEKLVTKRTCEILNQHLFLPHRDQMGPIFLSSIKK
jgi:16S rRNA C967 or C1407 C5-methylase (RsmB/RsmF family)